MYPKFLPIFFGVLAILKADISHQLQIEVNPFLVESPIVHEVIQHGSLQRLQLEVKKEDWDRNIPIWWDCRKKKIVATPIGNGGARLSKLTNCPNIPYQNSSSLIYPQISNYHTCTVHVTHPNTNRATCTMLR